MSKIYLFTLDNVLCKTIGNDFKNAIPIESTIQYLNELKSKGHVIHIWTDRENKTGVCHTVLTHTQLEKWKVNYDKLFLEKPIYDILYDVDENTGSLSSILNQ